MERGFLKSLGLRARLSLALVLFLFFASVIFTGHSALGAILDNRSVLLSDNRAGAGAFYNFQFDIKTPGTLGSIEFEFCSNSPIPSVPCVAPTGFNATGVSFGTQSGETGFNVSPLTTTNNLIISRAPSPDSAQTVNYVLGSFTNPSTEGSYYIRILTFATDDATGPMTDYGGLAYAINSNVQISTEVPPYLIFCAGVTIPAFNCAASQGSLVDMGDISSKKTSDGQSQLLVSTNAENGYSMYMQGTSLTSGNNTIASLNAPSSPLTGINQFGLNLRANLSPAIGQDPSGPGVGVPTSDYNQPNHYKFVSGDVIASTPSFEDWRRYTVSYIADATSTQLSGVYVSTLTYVCVGNF